MKKRQLITLSFNGNERNACEEMEMWGSYLLKRGEDDKEELRRLINLHVTSGLT